MAAKKELKAADSSPPGPSSVKEFNWTRVLQCAVSESPTWGRGAGPLRLPGPVEHIEQY